MRKNYFFMVATTFLFAAIMLSGCFKKKEQAIELCSNTCQYAYDGECDDGGPNSQYSLCDCGTDCADCAERAEADCNGSSSSSSSSSSSGGVTGPTGGSSSSSSGGSSSSSSSGGSSSSSSSGGSSSATVQFHLQGTYSGRSLQCLLPLTIKVYKVPSITGVNYCQYGSSQCSCGASFFNNIPSSSQPQSYGTQSINIADSSPACGASGVASFTLPVGNYMYRWESTVCCNDGGWNKKCFGYNGSFTVSNSDTQQACKSIQVYMPNLATGNTAGLSWIQNNCPF